MLFNWKLKILSPIVAIAMLFTMCPLTTFAQPPTWLHEVLEDRSHATSMAEIEHMVDSHPEWLSKKDDEGRTPLDIARANGLSEIVSFLTSPKCQVASLGVQIEELRRQNERLEERATGLQSQLAAMPRTSAILSSAYPVGSIYMSINDTDPSTLFGGTWERIKDTFLLAAGDNYSAGTAGGEAEHTLTIDEMPSYRHRIREEFGIWANRDCPPNRTYAQIAGNSADTKEWHIDPIESVGGGRPHNNMPPYITCYMWKRTA